AAPAMDRLRSAGLVDPIVDWIRAGRPYLGICLGLQLLFERSDEDGAETLGILTGHTRRLGAPPTLPHVPRHRAERSRERRLVARVLHAADFSSGHPWAGRRAAGDAAAVLATTEHGDRFVSAVARDGLLGVQFHPERSGRDGLQVLANFVAFAAA